MHNDRHTHTVLANDRVVTGAAAGHLPSAAPRGVLRSVRHALGGLPAAEYLDLWRTG